MKRSEKILSACITWLIAIGCISCAAWFALHYNAWFVPDEGNPRPAVSVSDIQDNKILLDLGMMRISEHVPDDDLEKHNTYGFPVGESPYLIYVEKGAHTLSVFGKDSYGLYTKRIYTWLTATGKSTSMTPTGVFTIGNKEEWHRWPANTYSPYTSTYFVTDNHYGGLFIHGPIYRTQNVSTLIPGTATKIGTDCSSGCLRTETEAAYFVYTMCPAGTQVKIVDGSPLGFVPDRQVSIYNQTVTPTLEGFAVNAIVPDKMEFSESEHTMRVGESYTPFVVTTPFYARNISGQWSANHPSIVSISGDTIWATGAGTTIVTLTTDEGHLTASMMIHVVVSDVDTSAAPPKTDGRTDVNDERITADYTPISESLLTIRVNGTDFAVNQSVKPLLRILGGNYHYSQDQSCAYEGYDKVYTYRYADYPHNGVCTISTVPILPDGGDAICEISVKDYVGAEMVTSEGIALGDSRAAVEQAYGTFYTEEAVDSTTPCHRMVYWAGHPHQPGVPYLYFTIDDASRTVTEMGIFSGKNIG